MTVVYVLIAVAVAVALYFLLVKKGEPPQLEDEPRPRELRKADARPGREVEPARAPRAAAQPGATPAEAKRGSGAPAPRGDSDAPPPEGAEEGEDEDELAVDVEAPAEPGTGRAALADRPDPARLRRGLAKSRDEAGFFGKLRAVFSGRKEIEPDIAEQIEEVLLASDVGVSTTQSILARVREMLSKGDLVDTAKVWESIRSEAVHILECDGRTGSFALRAKPTVVLMVGVNGCGKTTTIGKLATRLENNGVKCVLGAGDTFRAAAVQQLVVWGKRIGCEVVKGKDGADPGSVIFDSIKRAQELGADVVLADTAGRLHTKTNLMSEMKKIAKTAGKALDGAPHEVLLVIDATTGQNALAQAKEFQEALELTGIVLTKLDGTAKGGVILGISDSLQLPVRFVGLGERPDDLHEFSPEVFVEALLGKNGEAGAA